jgi:hypothetical protein
VTTDPFSRRTTETLMRKRMHVSGSVKYPEKHLFFHSFLISIAHLLYQLYLKMPQTKSPKSDGDCLHRLCHGRMYYIVMKFQNDI